jgi:hypothetical protein
VAELMPLEKLTIPQGYKGLTPECGPHCATKDGMTGHCQGCHRLEQQFNDARLAHREGRSYVGRIET